jgi:hypothetical protein
MDDDGTLREAFAAAETTAPHVGEEAWERLACGELSIEERERVLDHSSRCPPCGRVLRALVILENEAREFDPHVRPRSRMRRGALVAAAVAAAAAVAVWLGVPDSRTPLSDPSATGAGALRSGSESDRPMPRSPQGEVHGAPDGFSWDGTPGARSYRVELLDAEAESLWRSGEVAETKTSWPEDVPPEPGRYYWRVIATRSDRGETIASPLVSFEVHP